MYKLYLDKYETEIYEQLKSGEEIRPILKYEYFCKHFNTNYNLSFGVSRSDILCQTCDKLQNSLDSETNIELRTIIIAQEKEIHLKKFEVFYSDLRELSDKSKSDDL